MYTQAQEILTQLATAVEFGFVLYIAVAFVQFSIQKEQQRSTRSIVTSEAKPVDSVEISDSAPVEISELEPMAPQPILDAQPPSPLSLNTLNVEALRRLCSEVGIQWRNAHGKGKHLSKAEILCALAHA